MQIVIHRSVKSQTVLFRLLLTFFLTLAGFGVVHAANQCLSYLPADVATSGELKLCHSSYNGLPDQYSCQEYQTSHATYRVLYKGGLVPKAIVQLDKSGEEHVMWSTLFADAPMQCPLLPPAGITIHAKHLGVGVCVDEKDQNVPCSVYQHAEARDKESYRYMVFYEANGKGASLVDEQFAGSNEDAMVAEIAYQIGVQLLNTECCSERAIHYLEFAFNRYPQTTDYRVAYNSAKLLLAKIEEY